MPEPRTDRDVYAAGAARARDRARSTITHLVRDTAGDDAVRELPIWPGAATTEQRPTPRHGLRAALRLRDEATGHARRFIEELRGDGASWPDVAAEVRRHDAGIDEAAVQAVFEEFAAGGLSAFDTAWMSWRCSSCEQRITDHGPYNPHPSDIEEGHTADCERHVADVRTYEQGW